MATDRPSRLRILALASGGRSPFDGQWLVEYDPTRPGFDPDGLPIIAHLVTSPVKSDALEFATHADAYDLIMRAEGVRGDGEPNRPLTAFWVEITKE